MYRTHKCDELRAKNIGETVTLSGWVHRRRDHGDVIFVDLRDRYGLTQIAFSPSIKKETHTEAEKIRPEWVIQVTGKVRPRLEGQSNSNLKTGEIEVEITEMKVLNKSKTPPFEIDQDKTVGEEIRLKYRYLDIRRERMRDNIIFRSKVTKFIRDFYNEKGFLDIETPILIKGTPEGSREYLVPSRIYPGEFFVLPQSPQQLKQLSMVGGLDKYYQIARCFRDEDLRGDRQPEFTQIDVEMSFVEQEDVINIHEELFLSLSKEFVPEKKLKFAPFKRLTWKEAMSKYGSDKPDLRFDMEIKDVTEAVKNCGFKVFSSIANSEDGIVVALKVAGAEQKFTRKNIDDLISHAQHHGAKGLAYVQLREGELGGPVAKFLAKEELDEIIKITESKAGDIIFFSAGEFIKALEPLGQVRLKCGEMLNLIDKDEYAYAWVTEFPTFEKNAEGQIASVHHPFTRPFEKDLEKYENGELKNLTKMRSYAYDLTLNGVELGGGSIRIHENKLQAKMFKLMNISDEEAQKKFGHMLEAFEYGAPPHGGIAFGLDRIIMLFRGEPNIREVIPFPKDQKSKDLMLGAPAPMPKESLDELGIEIKKEV